MRESERGDRTWTVDTCRRTDPPFLFCQGWQEGQRNRAGASSQDLTASWYFLSVNRTAYLNHHNCPQNLVLSLVSWSCFCPVSTLISHRLVLHLTSLNTYNHPCILEGRFNILKSRRVAPPPRDPASASSIQRSAFSNTSSFTHNARITRVGSGDYSFSYDIR